MALTFDDVKRIAYLARIEIEAHEAEIHQIIQAQVRSSSETSQKPGTCVVSPAL